MTRAQALALQPGDWVGYHSWVVQVQGIRPDAGASCGSRDVVLDTQIGPIGAYYCDLVEPDGNGLAERGESC